MRRGSVGALARIAGGAVLLAWCSVAWGAGAHDPSLTWRTIESPRFRVHYPDGARNLGVRISNLAEEELDRVAALFGYAPDGPIEIVLTDASDVANGSANVVPSNVITVRLAAPTELNGLSSYDDWLRILIVHELAHICDIDQARGMNAFLAQIFGSYIRMNGYTPQFMSEGVAVYAETLLTATGRGRSPFVDMIIRTAVLDDEFVSIDRAHVFYADWPGGNGAYFYGGLFHLWLADRFGVAAVRHFHQITASMPLPFLYWPAAQKAFGASLPDLWNAWGQEELSAAQAIRDQVRHQGETTSRRITFHGRNLTGTTYSPDGRFILYSRSSPVDGATVRRVRPNGEDDEVVVKETYSPRFSFSPDGRGLYYSQNAINARFNDFNDLYRFDLESEDTVQLHDADAPTRSLRARDPDAAPDGRRLVFVQNRLHQSWLSEGTFIDEERTEMRVRVLVPPYGDTQQASPRYSPDGASIAVSSWLPGGLRDVLIIDAESGALRRRVTNDPGLDGNPAWSPDGRFLLYESDTSGISNIMAYDVESRAYFQVTNVVGGAYQPAVSPDGTQLVFRNASGIGFDVHEMPFDPTAWRPVRYDPALGYEPSSAPVAVDDASWPPVPWGKALPREAEAPAPLHAKQRDVDYTPWSLVPFNHNWILLPAVYVLGEDPAFRLTTFVRDTLGEHFAAFSIGSSMLTAYPSWAVSYTNDMSYPSLSVGYSDDADAFPYQLETGEAGHVVRIIKSAVGQAVLPLGQRHVIGAAYVHQHREGADALAADLFDLRGGRDFARLEVAYAYRNLRRYPYSVGAEDGGAVAVGARWYSRALGGSFDQLLLTLDARGYIDMPWLDNHVLALRLVSALALGPEFEERFGLGGSQSTSIFTVEISQVYPLRGFPLDLVRYPFGTGVLAAYLEYRAPLWQIQHGLWTIPIFVDKLHAAVFVEGGNTFGNGEERDPGEVLEKAWRRLQGGRLSAGAELRLDIIFGWAYLLSIRGGVAVPLIDHGLWAANTVVPYVTFGSPL